MSKLRFNFIKNYAIQLACATDEQRPALEHVFFMNGYAYASDAHILARVPLSSMTSFLDEDKEAALLEGKAIHKSVFSKILSYDTVTVYDGYIEALDHGHKVTFDLKEASSFQTIDFEAVLNPTEERVPVNDIGLNPKLLHRLAKAMFMEAVKMKFTSANKAIFVENNSTFDGALGVIMPVAIQKTIEGFD